MKLFYTKPSSKDVANERLKLILIHDRADLSPKIFEAIKSEILDIIAKYVVIDNSHIEVKLIKTNLEDGNSIMLVANIPIKSYNGAPLGRLCENQ